MHRHNWGEWHWSAYSIYQYRYCKDCRKVKKKYVGTWHTNR